MRLAFLLITAGTLGGCAAISSPEGGTRDTTLPKLIGSVPANGARNVTGQSIRLDFSEQVQLTDLAKNLLVAPVLSRDNTYKIREERTSVTLTFDQPFQPNTTYSFNFGEAISDITEKNKAQDVTVSFSTGAQLDSGAVAGRVVGLLSQLPAEGALVLLYPEADTSDIRKGVPTYLARTDKQGRYALRYLKAGRYRAYALADKNQTNRYEEPEAVAYRPGNELLTIGPRPDSLNFALTKPDSRRPLITTQKNSPTDQRVSYNEGLLSAALLPLEGRGAASPPPALQEAVQLTERNRTAVLYRTAALDEGRYLLAATDSAGNVSRDTITVRFAEQPPKAPKPTPAYSVEGNPREVYRQGQVKFVFTEPVRLIDPKKAFGTLVEDSVKRRPLRVPQDGSLSPDRTTLSLNLDTKAQKTITLLLDSTALQSVTGRALGLRPLKLRVVEQTTTGTLSGPIQTAAKRYWVQLLDDKGQVLLSLDTPKGSYRFDNLAPATYRLRVLVDSNQDGRWQNGDPDLKAAPEPIFLFPKPIVIRSNFDNVETLSF